MAVKYYVYVSESKVEMLFSQIPRTFLSGLAAELKVNLGILTTTLKQDADPETKFARLTAVVRYLEQNESIGTVDEPEVYFRGHLSMAWGPYGTYQTFTHRAGESPLMYFGAVTDKTIVGLGGSSRNMIGATGSSSAHSHSATAVMVARIYEGLELHLPADYPDEWELPYFSQEDVVPRAVEVATTQMEGPKESVEFFARRLAFYPRHKLSDRRTNMNILLGTPLYVALAE
jgi:hypothetical protein